MTRASESNKTRKIKERFYQTKLGDPITIYKSKEPLLPFHFFHSLFQRNPKSTPKYIPHSYFYSNFSSFNFITFEKFPSISFFFWFYEMKFCAQISLHNKPIIIAYGRQWKHHSKGARFLSHVSLLGFNLVSFEAMDSGFLFFCDEKWLGRILNELGSWWFILWFPRGLLVFFDVYVDSVALVLYQKGSYFILLLFCTAVTWKFLSNWVSLYWSLMGNV